RRGEGNGDTAERYLVGACRENLRREIAVGYGGVNPAEEAEIRNESYSTGMFRKNTLLNGVQRKGYTVVAEGLSY
ncbi:MAG: hypothetical protein ACI4S9_05165, partial [Christensenellales bacterium]